MEGISAALALFIVILPVVFFLLLTVIIINFCLWTYYRCKEKRESTLIEERITPDFSALSVATYNIHSHPSAVLHSYTPAGVRKPERSVTRKTLMVDLPEDNQNYDSDLNTTASSQTLTP